MATLTNGPIEHGFDVVNDVLEHLVMHLGEDDDLEEWLDSAQYLVRVGAHLIHEEVTNTLIRAFIGAARVHGARLRRRVAALLALMLL